MSLKPVLVVIPQRTLRFLSATRLGSHGCPPVVVAKRQGGVCQLEGSPPRTANGEEEEEEEGGTSGDEGTRFDDVTNVTPSRAVKHKAVEKRRKQKISEAVQQILEVLRPPSPSGKMTRADILEKAVDKIKTLKEENERLKSKIDSLPEPGGGGELEMCGELSRQILEFVSLKAQLQRHIERQQQLSCDQTTESHDTVLGQAVVDGDSEDISLCSQTVTVSTLSSSSTTEATLSNVRVLTGSPSVANPCTNIGNGRNTIATEASPLSQEAPPTNQPWPVTSILSRVRYTDHNGIPVSCHGDSLSTSRISHLSAAVQRPQTGLPLPPVPSMLPAPPTSHGHMGPRATATNTPLTLVGLDTPTSHTHSPHIQPRLRESHNVVSATAHVRSESGLGLTSRHTHHHHQRQRHSIDGFYGYAPEYYDPPAAPTALLPNNNSTSIVQPWVESQQRPRLHHVTRTTPIVSSSPHAHYPHHHGQSRHGSHSERFMPYPSTVGKANYHNTSTLSSSLWSHDYHVTSAGSGNRIGQNVVPLDRSYASGYGSHQQRHSTLHPAGGVASNNFDYSLYQGHPSPFYQSSERSGNVMSHDSTATPPYPIQPHPHTGSNSSPSVWRPYSESSRLSGFYLSDILSLPSESEAPPLQLEPTPPTGHRGIQSFQVNRLLEDI